MPSTLVKNFLQSFLGKLMGPNWTQAEMMHGSAANKMFIIAGPVIVYGVSASVVYGFIYWLTTIL